MRLILEIAGVLPCIISPGGEIRSALIICLIYLPSSVQVYLPTSMQPQACDSPLTPQMARKVCMAQRLIHHGCGEFEHILTVAWTRHNAPASRMQPRDPSTVRAGVPVKK